MYAACLAHEKLQNETITVLKVLRKVVSCRLNSQMFWSLPVCELVLRSMFVRTEFVIEFFL